MFTGCPWYLFTLYVKGGVRVPYALARQVYNLQTEVHVSNK